ncbi:MAG TPA: hypothetical protein PKM16_02565 [Bacteroidia bacterium]|nr:hypothetical protein [Bacteroidia bacterium]
MKSALKLLLGAALLLLSSTCNLINPDDPSSSFIQIDSVALNTDVNTQGSNTQAIKDAWLYIDNNLVGVNEIPFKIPVLEEGSHKIMVQAGIIQNGIAATRAAYPFYTFYDTTLVLTKTQGVVIHPTFNYFNVKFPWIESFNGPGVTLDSTVQSTTGVRIETDPLKTMPGEGNCGVIKLDTAFLVAEVATSQSYNLPKSGAQVYLEINYRCTNSFVVGIFANHLTFVEQRSILSLNPSDTWKKVYVEMGSFISSYPNAQNFKIYFGAVLNSGLINSEIYLDNIKIVHQ